MHGVLKFTLHPTSYEWQFIPTAGDFRDSGSARLPLTTRRAGRRSDPATR